MPVLNGGQEIVPEISVKTGARRACRWPAQHQSQNPHFSQRQGEMGHPSSSGSSPIACYISDLLPTTAQIDVTWGMGFDLYPLDTIASKQEIMRGRCRSGG